MQKARESLPVLEPPGAPIFYGKEWLNNPEDVPKLKAEIERETQQPSRHLALLPRMEIKPIEARIPASLVFNLFCLLGCLAVIALTLKGIEYKLDQLLHQGRMEHVQPVPPMPPAGPVH